MASPPETEPLKSDLARRALTGHVKFHTVFLLMLLVPAWSLAFWQAWLYWLVFTGCTTFVTLYFLKHDPALVASRLKVGPIAEREPRQKRIQAAASVILCAMLILPGIERHFTPSAIPAALVIAADVVVALGFGIIFRVLQENGHASSIIEVKPGQRVIATGPYAVLRHPMYAGATLLALATPLALGSLWTIPLGFLLVAVLAARLLDEERHLRAHLAGYDSYCRKVRFRLVPYIW